MVSGGVRMFEIATKRAICRYVNIGKTNAMLRNWTRDIHPFLTLQEHALIIANTRGGAFGG